MFLDHTTARTLAPVDPEGRLCYISLGCVIESLVLVAQADGLSPSVQVRHGLSGLGGTGTEQGNSADGGAGQAIDHIEITLDPISLEDPRVCAGVGTTIQQADALANLLRDPSRPRHTSASSSHLDAARPLSDEHARRIQEIAAAQAPLGGAIPPSTSTAALDSTGGERGGEGDSRDGDSEKVHTIIVTEPSMLTAIGNASVQAEQDSSRGPDSSYAACVRSFLHPAPAASPSSALGSTGREGSSSSIAGPAVGVYRTAYEPASLFIDTGKGAKLMSHAAASIIMCTPVNDPTAWIQCGRTFLRLACACSQAGVAVAWLHDPVGVTQARDSIAAIAHSARGRHENVKEVLIPQLVVRLGYLHAPQPMGTTGQGHGVARLAGEETGRKPLSDLSMRM